MPDHTEAGKRRQKVIDEFEDAGFTVDARPDGGDVHVKPYVEPGTDEYDEFVSFLKSHDAVTPRENAGDSGFIFTYDGSKL
jgi:hypothetical protein